VEACLNLPKERYAMSSNSTVVPLRQPDTIDDPLTAILRRGARRLLAPAIEAEADAFLAEMKGLRLADGRERVVRHGHGPERLIQTGIGPVAVERVKLHDRGAGEAGADRIRFTSAILPRWARRTRSLDALLPILYLRGVSMGDFQEALAALLGKDAPNLSPPVIARLRNEWEADYEHWQRRDLSARRYVYVWADGVYLQARMEPQADCMLVLIGATPEGKKELLGFQVGVRESAQSWRELLVDLKARGLTIAPELATGDGSLGFWKALEEVSPTTRHQRCTVHKTANVLDKLPKSVQPAAKTDLRQIWAAPDRATAETAIATFAEKYGAKYDKAVTAHLLRLSGRALGSPAHEQSDRERVRHCPSPHRPHQGRAVASHRPDDGVQTRDDGREDLAPVERRKPVAQGHPGHHIHQRRRGHQHASAERRLITASPKFPHSSYRGAVVPKSRRDR
jgi:putative transposase